MTETKVKKTSRKNTSQPEVPVWDRVLLARAQERPTSLDYIQRLCTQFVEVHGDRSYRDDPSIVGGFAVFEGKSVAVVGHQKGKSFKDRMTRNFGMSHPEGYRKALRIMRLAERFSMPILTFVDTPGAYPGIEAEERGQVEAVARNIMEMFEIRVPILVFIVGEGGSGGALAIGVGDRVYMLENAVYSVISPEACAAILWENAGRAPEAAERLRMTASDLLNLGIIDGILPEAAGGIQKDAMPTLSAMKALITEQLEQLQALSVEELLSSRQKKFDAMVAYREDNMVHFPGGQEATS
ncbi:acetyl-CoA carboxylase carboxyltransferase subunit alpha [Leptospirillum ferriphilum]|uniref:acetyl-CoA carboxylase carboxyltransferase subunit alpha n=1 Tax=Leptospirillum ferriphilum TaxID=178606 RepID=UPI0009860CDA|nr:acetyl-CoA carboxylase carboxyltransferase subunit alpha [Leptospirillum ferriphilum]OOH81763.1 acetyl-CoA carboxylase carboxyltransferase subunit alpha [Leptospirillum ferriphilum]